MPAGYMQKVMPTDRHRELLSWLGGRIKPDPHGNPAIFPWKSNSRRLDFKYRDLSVVREGERFQDDARMNLLRGLTDAVGVPVYGPYLFYGYFSEDGSLEMPGVCHGDKKSLLENGREPYILRDGLIGFAGTRLSDLVLYLEKVLTSKQRVFKRCPFTDEYGYYTEPDTEDFSSTYAVSSLGDEQVSQFSSRLDTSYGQRHTRRRKR